MALSPPLQEQPTRSTRAAWVDEIDRRTYLPLTIAALLLAPLLIAPDQLGVDGPARAVALFGGWLLWAGFALTMAARLILTSDRRGLLRRHGADLAIALMPLLLVVLPGEMTATIRLWWALTAGVRAVIGFRRALNLRGVTPLLIAAALLVAIAADLVLDAEHLQQGATITTFDNAIWWAVATVTSVGYGDRYPLTPTGRAIGMGLMILGIGLFSVLTARLASVFVEADEGMFDRRMDALDSRLERIESSLARRAKRQRPTLPKPARRLPSIKQLQREQDRVARRGRSGERAESDPTGDPGVQPVPNGSGANGSRGDTKRSNRGGSGRAGGGGKNNRNGAKVPSQPPSSDRGRCQSQMVTANGDAPGVELTIPG